CANDVAVTLAETRRDARGRGFAEGQVERGEPFDEIVAARPDARAAGELAELWLAGADQDRAADRVAAEQRALRAAQDLDAADVAEFDRAADRATDVNLVDVDADARIDRSGRVQLAYAADECDRGGAVTRQLAGGLELQARRDALEVLRLLDLPFLERLGAEGRDGSRSFLQRFLAPARSYQDGVARVLLSFDGCPRRRVLRSHRGAWHGAQRSGCNGSSRQQHAAVITTRLTNGICPHHLSPPRCDQHRIR